MKSESVPAKSESESALETMKIRNRTLEVRMSREGKGATGSLRGALRGASAGALRKPKARALRKPLGDAPPGGPEVDAPGPKAKAAALTLQKRGVKARSGVQRRKCAPEYERTAGARMDECT